MPPLRFVLDTNVVIPALLSHSEGLAWMREAWQARRIVPLVNSATADELHRVIAYSKFRLAPDEQAGRLADYIAWCEVVDVSAAEPVPECRDPSDVPFLQLALSGEADAIVTGDQDLLVLAPAFSVPILTAQEARERLANA